MGYFSKLPTLKYNGSWSVDLNKTITLLTNLDSNWIMNYRMTDGENLHTVSYNLYDTIEYWWLLAILNNIEDIHYDILIKDDVLQELANQLQTVQLNNLKDFIICPVDIDIEYDVDGTTYYGIIKRKYIKGDVEVDFEGANRYYLVDIFLDNPNVPIPSVYNIRFSSTSVSKIKPANIGNFVNGDPVRQDKLCNSKLYEFARGIIIYIEAGYIYVHKTKPNIFTVTGVEYECKGNTVIGSVLNTVKKTYLDGVDIVESEEITEISVSQYGNRVETFLIRYDALVDLNNANSILTVIKPTYINTLLNNLTLQEG